MLRTQPIRFALVAAGMAGAALLTGAVHAALPSPTPAQQQAAAAKKAKDDAQAAKDKESLGAAMDGASARWRARAAREGWATHPAVAVAAPAAAPTAAAASGAANPAANAGVLVRSEKLGTAAPSEDVKRGQTRAQPAGAPPTLVKKNTPQLDNR